MSITCPTCTRTCEDDDEYCLRCRTRLSVAPTSSAPGEEGDFAIGIAGRVFIVLLLFLVGAMMALGSHP